ncbi:MAG: peptidoglycan editing factor PgeF [Candidatus Gastranaerophilales bacterium]|nr:peptidoglycan editing factor PgeF [Candidatus Gastranaerophilales bacterium]
MFYFEKINGKNILKSDLIKDAEAFFTTRDICICDKDVNNDKISIQNNKILITNHLKISEKNLISPTQTHSANIDIAIETRQDYPETDALILKEKNLAIFLNFADCTPVILYDKKQNIGAIAHAGWRGTAQKIATLTVNKMGSKPEDIIAIIGPAIGFCCYNVGEEVYEKLAETVSDFEGLFEIREGKIFVDLKNINKRQLEEIGVKEIDVCPYCTVHNNDKFFSYRNENATTLRHSAVLKLS